MSVFENIFERIRLAGYHNQRQEAHSDIISHRIIEDLRSTCQKFDDDCSAGVIQVWHKTKGPDDRTTDLLAGRANLDGSPDLTDVRLLVEHKSVMTAHRNRNARWQDIDRERLAAHRANPKTIVAATVIVGTCERFLNIPDCVAKFNKARFKTDILPRLSTGDASLWTEFAGCISYNQPNHPIQTINMFRQLPVRRASDTHLAALDYLLIAPVAIDNVNPASLDTRFGIDANLDYQRMIHHICRLYDLRWHDGV